MTGAETCFIYLSLDECNIIDKDMKDEIVITNIIVESAITIC